MAFRSSANGIAKKGKTAGKMVTMAKGGKMMAKGGKMAAGGKMKKYPTGGAVTAPTPAATSPTTPAATTPPASSMASKRPMHAPRPMAHRRMAKGGKMKGC
jgi:hypothetical protein